MKTCFLSIDVEKRENQEVEPFEGVKKLDNILNIFRKYQAKATLFVTGEVLEHYPDLVGKWSEDFEIGCHNYYHVELDKVDLLGREKQIKDFIRIYADIFKHGPLGFRAPRNIIDNEHFEILERYSFLYDSSVLPRYPLGIRHYEGYQGRAPIKPYWPSKENYKKESSSTALRASNKLLEIPEAPAFFNIPLVGTWLRKLGVKFFKFLFYFKKPDFISLSMHSWDGVKFEGRSSKNSGPVYLKQLDEITGFLKKIGYEFKSGEQIYEEFLNPKSYILNPKQAYMFTKLSKQEYKKLLEQVLFKTFFHEIEWHEFLEKEFKWLKFEYYLYKPARPIGGDEAILPLAGFKIFGKEKLVSLPFCEYGGPLPLKQEIDFDEFKKDVLSEFGENIKIKFHPEILKYFHFSEAGIKNYELESDVFTSWIEDLKNTNEEQLLASFRKTLRYEIRDAQQKDLLIKKCENLKELKQFYNLYVINLKRKKTIPYPFSIFEFLYHSLNTEIILAFFKGKIIGGNLFVNYGNFVHYFFSASDYNYKDFSVSYLLLWSKIKGLIGQDKILDLGATPKDSSLDVFKRGWGGTEYPILQLGIKKSSEKLRSSKLRNIWGLMPNSVIKNLSRYLIKYRL